MMHKIGFNKYLKNIGITEDKYWVYNDEAKDFDPRYQPDEDGFIEADATVMMRVILLIAILAATGISAVVLKQVCKTIMSLGRARKKNIA